MNEAARNATSNRLMLAGIEIELIDRGSGAPILYLHGGAGIRADLPFIELLAKTHRVIAPSHPGFGTSTLPDWLDSVDDVAHVHLELLDRLGLRNVDLIGMSLGGWVAAEMATKTPERFARVALIGPVESPDRSTSWTCRMFSPRRKPRLTGCAITMPPRTSPILAATRNCSQRVAATPPSSAATRKTRASRARLGLTGYQRERRPRRLV